MSKELWFADYEWKLNELADSGLSIELMEDEASVYADGYMERLVGAADNLRKAEKENG